MPSLDPQLVFPGDSELAALMRAKRWADTPLGPAEGWPGGLRAAVRILLTSRFAMWMGWGDELTFFYNDAYRRDTLGAKHPRALGIATSDVWREIWPEIEPRIASVLTSGEATWDEGLMLMLERNGYREETYHTFSYSPLHDDHGQARGVLCVVVEETPRLLSERRVALLGRLASETVGALTRPAAFAAIERSLAADARDLPFTLTYLLEPSGSTARLASHTGLPAGWTGAAATIDLDDRASPWPLRAVLETARPIEVELEGSVWPAGPWATPPARAFVLPIAQQGQARPAGVFIAGINPHRLFDVAYRDFITLVVGQLAAVLANVGAHEAERLRAEALAELDRAKTTFFSNVSHEFRTPLTLMLGPLEGLLADPELAAATRAEVATIHRNGLRLLKLVNTMLDFSRIEAGRVAAQFVPTDLAQLTADLASVFRAATDKAGLRLNVACPPLDVPVRVDRDMWEKIVLNLVSNAFKFTLEGEITVALVRRGDTVELSVRDTGNGIPADELPRVFDRFHRVAGTSGRTHEGTGIGLALVQELVRLHGGSIEVASELGCGTTFTVTVPLGDAASAVASAAPAAPVEHGPATTAFVEEALRWLPAAPRSMAPDEARARLLIADDNADMRDYLGRLLGERWAVDVVGNGEDALAAIRARRPDLVISDVMMPVLDGIGLLVAIRADPALRELPVILLSARAGEEARIEGLQAGATDYLAKPFSARELVARVETQLLHAMVRAAEAHHVRRLATVFEQAPVAMAILRGPEHVFEVANPLYRSVIGGRDVVGQRVVEALPEVVAQGFVAALDRVFQSGVAFVGRSHPVRLQRTPDGPLEEMFFDLTYQPLVDAAGTITGIAGIAHDVTALAIARRDAEVASRTKDEFLAMLGHELRNPLAPITTALELMRMQPGLGAERERAVIQRQVQHLIGLVDDLLDISRITRGKVELRSEPVEVADLVARSLELVSPLLDAGRHAVSVDVAPGLVVHGDPGRLAQVLSNLLNNAAKYTPAAGAIAVSARRDGDDIEIRVRDNGIGIDAAMLPRIFEPFAQAQQALDRAQGGLGLGLAIVDNLVKLHGGTVGARSEGRGQGTELTVRLPRLERGRDAAPVARANGVVGPGSGVAGATSVGTGHVASAASDRAADGTRAHDAGDADPAREAVGDETRILIIDDNTDAAFLLAELLAVSGYQTLAAHDGPSALQAARSFRPHLAVVDLGLPVMDGFELARHLRTRDDHPPPRLVALTGYGQPEDRAKTTAAGFDAHLVKPVDLTQLHAVLARLVPRG